MSTPQPISADDFRRLQGEVSDIKELMGQMTAALTRLALLEERQQSVTTTATKILDQIEGIRASQHNIELRLANYTDLQGRVERLESTVREIHLEQEREKSFVVASFRTTKLFIGGTWAVLLALGGVIGFATKLYGGA